MNNRNSDLNNNTIISLIGKRTNNAGQTMYLIEKKLFWILITVLITFLTGGSEAVRALVRTFLLP